MNKLVVYTLLLLLGSAYCAELSAETQPALSGTQKESLSRVQVPFIKNEGQIKSDDVKFYVQTFNGAVYVTGKGELIYTITNTKDYLGLEDYLLPDGSFSGRYGFSLKETPLTDKLPQINGLESSSTAVNYFIGDNPKDWRSNIQTYNLITLGEVWPGITVNLKANSKNIEKLFIVNPDGNPESIRFSVAGIEELSLNQTGELELRTQRKSIGFTRPVAYQEIPARPDGRSGRNGDRKSVEVSFRLIDKNTYGFIIGDYDKTIPLVIDPLLSSTFIGGFGTDIARAVVIDPVNGNVFVTGFTQGVATFAPGVIPGTAFVWRNNFPTQGQTPLAPYNNGTNILYLGAYVGGPGGPGFLNPPPGGGPSDIVICKLNPTLTTLIASTYLGGLGSDGAFGIALDSQGNVFVCGFAGPGFPVLTDRPAVPNYGPPTAFDTSYNGPSVLGQQVNPNDGFVSKLSNSLNALLASTYIGGTAQGSLTADALTGIVVDDSDNIFVCGFTDSDTFPSTGGPTYQGGASSVDYNFGNDAIVAKFNNNLSNRIPGLPDAFYYAGIFLGGTPGSVQGPNNALIPGAGSDIANAIAINNFDDQDNIYITGATTLGNPPFPTTGGAYDRSVGYDVIGTTVIVTSDAFICQFSNDLRTLRASTYLGGNKGAELGYALTLGAVLEGQPTVYVTGVTGAEDFPVTANAIPTWNPYGATQAGLGSQDVFVSRLTSNLTRLVNSTWIGGVDTETVYSISTGGSNNNIYICGTAESGDFPTTLDSFALTNTGGAGDVFVCSFNETLSILNASTMVGGQFLETAYAIRPDNTGNMIFVGVAGDGLYPTWPTTGTNIAYDTSYNGSGDIFVTRITNDLTGGLSQQPQPSPPGNETFNEGEGIIAGSSALAYLPADAFKQNCFIATAVYGNPMHPNVVTLRNFRDKYLLTNKLGSSFVDWYYRTSPPVAKYLKHTPLQASAVRCALAPIVYTIKYPILIPIIGGLLLALCYWIKRRYASPVKSVQC
ncbi:MAG: CFI-box-CTERM domain-containing protein [Planctomycetota bacterium]